MDMTVQHDLSNQGQDQVPFSSFRDFRAAVTGCASFSYLFRETYEDVVKKKKLITALTTFDVSLSVG